MQLEHLKHSELFHASLPDESLGSLLFLALETAEMATWMWNFTTDSGSWSPKLYQLFEIDPSEEVKQETFFSKIHPEYKEKVEQTLQNAISIHKDETLTEYPIILKNGELRWIEQRAMIRYSASGELCDAIGICWETTKHKNLEICLRNSLDRQEKVKKLLHDSERKLRTVLDSTDAKVVVINTQLKMVMGNRAFYDLIKLSALESIGQPIGFIFGEKNWAKLLPYFNLVLESANPITFECNLKLINGGPERYFRISLHPELDSSSRVSNVLGTFLDISPQKTLEFSLRNAKNAAELASKHKSEFLSLMSHEMRTPLHAIMAFTEMLEKSQPTSVQSKYLATMKKSEQHLLGLINDVLSLSQIESGKLELHQKPFDFPTVIDDCLAVFSSINHEDSGLTLSKNIAWEPGLVIGDEQRIRQVLMNLISNAVKFTKKGQVTVSLEGVSNGNLVKIKFSVKDNGPGIEKSKQKEIFDSFYRLSNHLDIPGTGLGLAICKGIVEKMNGEIYVKSVLGEGSEFFCRLLLKVAEDKDNIPKINTPESSKIFYDKIRRILVVDDDPINLKIMKTYFNGKGLDCIEFATNGREALESIQDHSGKPFDLVLMDIRMPTMDGYEATKKIREFERVKFGKPNSLIIALSASSLKEEVERCMAAGCNLHLSKPIGYELLIEQTSKLL